jgi:hypothetical protein
MYVYAIVDEVGVGVAMVGKSDAAIRGGLDDVPYAEVKNEALGDSLPVEMDF